MPKSNLGPNISMSFPSLFKHFLLQFICNQTNSWKRDFLLKSQVVFPRQNYTDRSIITAEKQKISCGT